MGERESMRARAWGHEGPQPAGDLRAPLCPDEGTWRCSEAREAQRFGVRETSAEFEDLSTGGKQLGSQMVVEDISSMPPKARRDTRDLRGHCGSPQKTIHSSNASKALEHMQIAIAKVFLRWSGSSRENRTHNRWWGAFIRDTGWRGVGRIYKGGKWGNPPIHKGRKPPLFLGLTGSL